MYFLEGGPLLRIPPPAAQHDLIEHVWTQHRLRQVDLHDREKELKPAIHRFVFVIITIIIRRNYFFVLHLSYKKCFTTKVTSTMCFT